jgi:hypothetical protein
MSKMVTVTMGDETMELSCALVSGRMNDVYGMPTSCYAGNLDPDDIHTALYYANRTVIRMLTEEFHVPIEKVDEFLLSALSEALVKEHNNRAKGTDDMDIRKTLKFKKNQN